MKKRTGSKKGILYIIVATLVVIMIIGGFALSYKYVLEGTKAKDKDVIVSVDPDKGIALNIPMGSSTTSIASLLLEEKIIKYPKIFKLMSKLNGYDGRYKSGTHIVSKDLDYDKLMTVLTSNPISVKVTIPEGFNFRQITDALVKKGLVDGDKFIKLANSEPFSYKFLEGLGQRENKLEGYLFPDTYEFDMKVGEKQILKSMLENFNLVFKPEYYEQAKKLNMTTDKIIILASIIEKEAKAQEDRKMIAGVFYNRLSGKYNVPKKLESCATIQYIFFTREGVVKDKIYEKDTEIKDPYNTYENEGLPPGPICSPGKASIEAALNPQQTDNLYFVAKGDGTHYFSKTLSEHQAASRKYGVN